MNVAIVGAGLSGLCSAYYLEKYLKNAKITIFESENEVGGKLKTVEKEGFLIEYGANGFLSNKESMWDIIDELGIREETIYANKSAQKRYIYLNNKLQRMPENPKSFMSSKLLSTKAKLRLFAEFLIPKKSYKDELLRDFGYRRVGKEFTDIFLDAMTAGIFASTPEKLSVNAAFPIITDMEKEYGSLIKAMIKKKKKSAGPAGGMVSFKKGVGFLIDTLEKKIDAEINKNYNVEKVYKLDKKWIISSNEKLYEFDAVILSTPSFVTANIIKEYDESLSDLLKQIEYSPMAVVTFGYDNLDNPLDGFGFLTTKKSNSKILGALWDSSVFEGRSQDNKKLIRVMIGGQRNPELVAKNETELAEIAYSSLNSIMDIKQRALLVDVIRWFKAIPNYNLGHIELREKIFDRVSKQSGLYLNSNAYYGVSMADCVKNSKNLALEMVKNQ